MRLQDTRVLQFPGTDSTTPVPDNALDGYTVSASFDSIPFFVGRDLGYTVVISCPSTGTPNATCKLQGCIDPARGEKGDLPDAGLANAVWWDLDLLDPQTNTTSVTRTISGATTAVFMEDSCMYRWIRLVWTNTSGSAVVTARIQFKGIS